MAGASAEGDMGRAGGGAVLLICRDARLISGYVEVLIGEARGACWFGLGGTTVGSYRPAAKSSRSRLSKLEAGVAAGTSRLLVIVRSLSRSLAQLSIGYLRKTNSPKSSGDSPSSLGGLQHDDALPDNGISFTG
jgi:hypothetical protein